jgi:predicted regulator of Ras-like GTPase activity (Roadblock/LC7/MglB family)
MAAVGRKARELSAWECRILVGCLHDLLLEAEAVCALLVRDDSSVLAKVATDGNLDVDTLGTFSSMIFAISRLLLQTLGTEGEVLGLLEFGADQKLLIMGITPQIALVTLSRTNLAKGLLERQVRAIVPRIVECLNHSNCSEL